MHPVVDAPLFASATDDSYYTPSSKKIIKKNKKTKKNPYMVSA